MMVFWTTPIARAGLAALAVGYLVAMVVVGAQPVQRQLVRSEARGVLAVLPETVQEVELTQDGKTTTLTRQRDGAWARKAAGPLSEAAAKHVETGLKMLHRSAPVREIEPEELKGVDTRPFGLDQPVIVVTARGNDGKPLRVSFGALNPEGFLQYARVDGQEHTYLLSRFIGAEWAAAAQAITR